MSKATLLIASPVIDGSKDPWDFICRERGFVRARIEDKAWWKRFMAREIQVFAGKALEVYLSPFKVGDIRLIMKVIRSVEDYAYYDKEEHMTSLGGPGAWKYKEDNAWVKMPLYDEDGSFRSLMDMEDFKRIDAERVKKLRKYAREQRSNHEPTPQESP